MQVLVKEGAGVKILAVLRDHCHIGGGFAGALHQTLLQKITHGDQTVTALVQPVADTLGNAPQQFVFHRQNAVQVFRPDVQHIVGQGNVMAPGIADGGPAHEHRAGIEAEHRIIPAGQTVQIACCIQRPADVVQEDVHAGVAPAGQFLGPEHLRGLVIFFKRTVRAVAVEPFALGVVGQSAQHVHLQPVGQKPFHNIVDAEVLRPEVLGHDQNSFFRHWVSPRPFLIVCATPSC